MPYSPNNPLIVQSDRSVLLEVQNERYEAARDALARFAELQKSPEFIHTYKITPLSLWNAAAAGLGADEIVADLSEYAKFDVPENVIFDIRESIGRYGRVRLEKNEDGLLILTSTDVALLTELTRRKELKPYLLGQLDANTLLVDPARRGHIKQALVHVGYPAEDVAGYVEGAPLELSLLAASRATSEAFTLRRYQQDAIDTFHAGGSARGGSGVIVLPCGAGKTLVGMGAIQKLQCNTLILTPSTVAARQWIRELLDKTTITEDMVGEYTGLTKEIKPITVTTYQIMTWRPRRKRDEEFVPENEYPHFSLFDQRDWGLIIYDEVHLLPAPVFRITAEIQARRRLGLTATLVREDNREEDVFSLVGPKKYDVPWKDLEAQGWIATAECHEIRISLPDDERMAYALAEDREKYRTAATTTAKIAPLVQLLSKHRNDQVLVIGQYIDQLERVAEIVEAPLITGSTPVRERERLFQQMRDGELNRLVVSKVANFAVDLPEVNVAIQISGSYGSRQEEAQRLGRILRPKKNGLLAHFYTLVTKDTNDQEFAANRQLFLTEQGYRYEILYAHEIPDYQPNTYATPGDHAGSRRYERPHA